MQNCWFGGGFLIRGRPARGRAVAAGAPARAGLGAVEAAAGRAAPSAFGSVFLILDMVNIVFLILNDLIFAHTYNIIIYFICFFLDICTRTATFFAG